MPSLEVQVHILIGLIAEYEISGKEERARGIRELVKEAGYVLDEDDINYVKERVRVSQMPSALFSVN